MITTLEQCRAVIKACKFGGKTIKWNRLSEMERMCLRDAALKAYHWGNDAIDKSILRVREISEAKQSDIDWDSILSNV